MAAPALRAGCDSDSDSDQGVRGREWVSKQRVCVSVAEGGMMTAQPGLGAAKL
jgi:hypothetical protein